MLQPAKSQYGQRTRSVTHTTLKDNSSKINIIQQKNPTSRFPASSRFTVSSIFTHHPYLWHPDLRHPFPASSRFTASSIFTASISGIIHIYGIHFRHHPDLRHHPYLRHPFPASSRFAASSIFTASRFRSWECVWWDDWNVLQHSLYLYQSLKVCDTFAGGVKPWGWPAHILKVLK